MTHTGEWHRQLDDIDQRWGDMTHTGEWHCQLDDMTHAIYRERDGDGGDGGVVRSDMLFAAILMRTQYARCYLSA